MVNVAVIVPVRAFSATETGNNNKPNGYMQGSPLSVKIGNDEYNQYFSSVEFN